MLWFCLLAFLAPQPRWPIQSLAVEGNHNYSSEQILKLTGLKVGQLAGKAEFEAAYDRLTKSGAFETVDYRFGPGPDRKGYSATFRVMEVEPVYPLRFEELGVPDGDVLAWLRAKEPLFNERMPATQPIVNRLAAEIEALLEARKKPQKVSGRVVSAGPEKLTLLFRPARRLPTVAQVTFTGNQVVPSTVLLDAISGVAIGAPYTEERFRQLLDTSVRPVYEARGRIRVAWTKVTTEKAPDVDGLHVTVAVNEGNSYDLGKVTLANTAPLTSAELLKTAKFKPGDLANFDVINQGLDRIRQAYRRTGFLKVETEVQRKIDDAAKKVDLSVRVNPGPRFQMGKLDVQGLDLHGEAAIRKMWALKEGSPYREDYPAVFLMRVQEAGVFDNLKKTKPVVKINEATKSVDVTLVFN